jgi:hypothetical protein
MSTKIVLESSIAYSVVQHDLMSNIKGVLKDSKIVFQRLWAHKTQEKINKAKITQHNTKN